MKAIILSLFIAVSSVAAFVAPAKAYTCYSAEQYQRWGAACN